MIEHFGSWDQYRSVPTTLLERQVTVWLARMEGRNQNEAEYIRSLGS